MPQAPTTERSPLLGNQTSEIDPENAQDLVEDVTSTEQRSSIDEPSDARLALIMGSIWIGVVLTAIDSTIVATLLVSISSSFSSLKTLSWIGSAYLIGQSTTQPLSGRLTDIFGRRQGLLVCNVLFALGTLLCGLAPNEWVLILGRTMAGLGGGAMNTICMFVTGDLVLLRKRGVIQGILNIAIGAGSGLGGLLGGWLDALWGWRMAFLVQVPLVIGGAVAVQVTVKVPKKKSEKAALRRVDFWGAGTLTCALVLLLLGINTGGNILPWSHPLVILSIISSANFLFAFIYVEERVALEPIIPIRLLFSPTVAAACISYLFTFMSFYGLTFFMPVYLQLVGNSPTEAGVRFIASSLGTAVGALTAGIMMRATGHYSYVNKASHGLLVLGSGLMLSLDYHKPAWCPFVYLAIFGLGFGGMLVSTLIALVSAVEQEEQAVVTSAAFAFRSVGSAVGLTVASAAFQNLLRVKLRSSIGDLEDADGIIGRIRDNFDEVNHLPAATVGSVRNSYMGAIRAVFLITCGFSILAAGASLGMRQHTLHSNLARHDDEH